MKKREPKDESGVTAEAIQSVQFASTERLIHDLNHRILRIGDRNLRDKCSSLGMQLAFAIGLDEHAIETNRKAVGA